MRLTSKEMQNIEGFLAFLQASWQQANTGIDATVVLCWPDGTAIGSLLFDSVYDEYVFESA